MTRTIEGARGDRKMLLGRMGWINSCIDFIREHVMGASKTEQSKAAPGKAISRVHLDPVVPVSLLEDMLECPVCLDSMQPPIYQCGNGHALCANCKLGVKNLCPICRGVFGNIRCLALEKMAKALELPCKCQGRYWSQDQDKELETSRYYCPNEGQICRFAGNIPCLVKHLRDDHEVDIRDRCCFIRGYILSGSRHHKYRRWRLTGFHCFGRHFCLQFVTFHLEGAPVYMAFLRFLGSEEEAKQFNYSLQVGRNGWKLTWQGVPRSIRPSGIKVRDSLDGLIVPHKLAVQFWDSDKKELRLDVAGHIWKQDTYIN